MAEVLVLTPKKNRYTLSTQKGMLRLLYSKELNICAMTEENGNQKQKKMAKKEES